MDQAPPSIVWTADRHQSRTLVEMRQHGYSLCPVPDGRPPYVYTIGLSLTYQHPEIIVSTPVDVGLAMLGQATQAIRGGIRLTPGPLYQLWHTDTTPVQFAPVRAGLTRYLHLACTVLHTQYFAALQLLYTDEAGHWPWDPSCDPAISQAQRRWCAVPRPPYMDEYL
jgi:uncharacterized protein DUF4262